MGALGDIDFVDLERAAATRSPELARLVIRYCAQQDPPPGASDDPSAPPTPVPADAWTVDRVRAVLSQDNLAGKDDDEKKTLRHEAWTALSGSAFAPERLKLGDLLIGLYEEPDAWARSSLVEIVKHARLRWGIWKAFKALYKEAERRHDAELFGALAYRLDATASWNANVDRLEVSGRTTSYLRRRAFRYLRWLGQSVPELYPEMAIQVLRHYPQGANLNGAWVAAHIMAHRRFRYMTSVWFNRLGKLEDRAFDEAWKRSHQPLLRLLEDAEHEVICEFAIKGLEADFKEELRQVEPAWLSRVGKKPLAVTQELVVGLLGDNPAFHQSKLRELGLEEMVVGFLASASEKVADYAAEYVEAHAPELGIDRMIELAERSLKKKPRSLIVSRLEALSPEALGLRRLLRMIGVHDLRGLAEKKIQRGFKPQDLDEATFVEFYKSPLTAYTQFLDKLFADAEVPIPTAFLVRVLSEPDLDPQRSRAVQQALRKRPGREIGMAWFKTALFERATSALAASLLRAGALAGDDLDVEWVKDLTRRPTQRALALTLLSNAEIVAPKRMGVAWLLSLLTRADPALNAFGRRTLLSSFGPGDFDGGIDGLFRLTDERDERGRKRPEAVRAFAFDWLRMHHPELNPESAEARSLGVEPKASFEVYAFERVAPMFTDHWAPARQFATDITDKELLRWNDPDVLYALARSRFVETRRLGIAALLSLGKAQGGRTLPEAWLSGDRVFQMAESPVKATRELALTLIREHYDRIGGKDKLAWLMESPEREVRLFAVRLLFSEHRPGGPGKDRFDSDAALTTFLRTVLFGLPPGRMERREGGKVDRPLRSGVAKRRLIELVRDMGLDDADFAKLVIPILEELCHSRALGEWQASVAALARLRSRHPGLSIALPEGATERRPRLEGGLA